MTTLFGTFGRARGLNVVVVQTKTGNTIRGVLVDRSHNGLILRAAAILSLGVNNAEEWKKAIGEVVIPMENVDYWQEHLGVEVLD